MTATIQMNKSALFELVMAAMEAYAIKHDGKKEVAVETIAHLWGTVNKNAPFKCKIEHVSVETSAERKRGSVWGNPESLKIKKDIASAFGDGYGYIGSFHTHPWLKNESLGGALKVEGPDSIRKYKLFRFSDGDHRCEVARPEITVGKKQYSIALVMTVFSMDRVNDQKDGRLEKKLFEFSLGNIKFWLKAQVFEHKSSELLSENEIAAFESYGLDYEDYESEQVLPVPIDTELDCKALSSFDLLLKDFGRLKAEGNSAEYRNKDVAETR